MPESPAGPTPPAIFASAVESLRAATLRPELAITEISAPTQIAPWSFALAADVTPSRHGEDSDLGTGRFVLLYDPASPDAWEGEFRIICFAQAPLEPDIGVDEFLSSVTWSWLVDALDSRGAKYDQVSGTATRILSTGFGELESQPDGAQIELRASWSPQDLDIAAHVEGWSELVCMLAGLPPTIEGVTMLSARRAGRE
ncbi:DUF3000 domain-containing protein [Salinibacterium amurskyense]|uniref:DUF3000 domain-containing protein n=1 Tax=Salinibacterium amurskyense TaxID=205941 RepID=UPI00311FFD4C